MTHQGVQIALNRFIIILLRLAGVGFHQLQNIGGRFMQLLVQRLYFLPQLQNSLVVCARFAIKPLPQHTGGGVHAAGKFCAGIKSVAQVAGPFIVGAFGLLASVQQRVGLGAGLLGPLHPQDIDRHRHAEQQHRNQRGDHPNSHHLFNTFSHQHIILSVWRCFRPSENTGDMISHSRRFFNMEIGGSPKIQR